MIHLARLLSQGMMEAVGTQNLAFLHGRRGNLPAALEVFDRARAAYASIGDPPRLVASLDVDESELLLAAGLTEEAATVALAAVRRNVASGNSIGEGDARLLLSQALLQAGRSSEAEEQARAALAVLRADDRDAWAALARFVQLRAELTGLDSLDDAAASALMQRAVEISELLQEQGWEVEALEARTEVAQALYDHEQGGLACDLLVAALDLRRNGSPLARITGWRTEALRRLTGGRSASAARALVAGLRRLEDHRASLGATELRARASGHGAATAALGIRLAVQQRRAREVLLWSERFRAAALLVPPARPPDDSELADELAHLRQLRAAVRDTTASGGDPQEEARRLAAAERRLTHLSRRLDGIGHSEPVLTMTALRRLIDGLGDLLLVEFVTSGDELWSVTVVDGTARLHSLGAWNAIVARLDELIFALRRSRPRSRAERERDAADALFDRVTGTLDSLLLPGLEGTADRSTVIVPTGPLHDVPWGCLRSLHHRAVTVAPSLRLWSRPPPSDDVAAAVGVVAGPSLPGAAREARMVADLHPAAELLVGSAATPDEVLRLLERSELAHIAVHGRFREPSPMFSELLLEGGSITVHDIESLRRVPDTIVLPACEAGRHRAHAGDELIGTVGALLSLGVGSVIAPVVAVADDTTAGHMVAFHERLLAGDSPPLALAHVRRAAAHASVVERATAGSFTAFGTRT